MPNRQTGHAIIDGEPEIEKITGLRITSLMAELRDLGHANMGKDGLYWTSSEGMSGTIILHLDGHNHVFNYDDWGLQYEDCEHPPLFPPVESFEGILRREILPLLPPNFKSQVRRLLLNE